MDNTQTKPIKISDYYFSFENRAGRYEFLRSHFAGVFDSAKTILDVGCDENYLKSIYGSKVFGVDIGGSPDRVVDLEKEKLSFVADTSYELVICTEVLEHIDNLHEMMDELFRVSSRFVLISLPNCSSTSRIRKIIMQGKNGKFYGLPFTRPIDRHKWFFSYKEIIHFMKHMATVQAASLVEMVFHYNIRYQKERRPLHLLKQFLHEITVRVFRWNNQCQDVFFLFEK